MRTTSKKEFIIPVINWNTVIILLLSSVMILGLSGCNKKPVGNEMAINEPGQIEEENVWKEYSDDDLGLSFKYPSEYNIYVEKEGPLDKGRKKEIIIRNREENIVTFIGTSFDYESGIEEGCCFYFSDEKIDISKSDDFIKEQISSLKPVNLEKIQNENNYLKFQSIKKYQDFFGVESLLIPLKKQESEFSNVLVSGPVLIRNENDIYEELKNKSYLVNSDINKKLEIYYSIIETIVIE